MAYRTVNSSAVIAYAGGIPRSDLRLRKREFIRYARNSLHYSTGRTMVQFSGAGIKHSHFQHSNYQNVMASVPDYYATEEEENAERNRRGTHPRAPSYSNSVSLSDFRGNGYYRLLLLQCILSPLHHSQRKRREAGREASPGAVLSTLQAHINESELSHQACVTCIATRPPQHSSVL